MREKMVCLATFCDTLDKQVHGKKTKMTEKCALFVSVFYKSTNYYFFVSVYKYK